MTILVDSKGKKFITAGPETRLHCPRELCVWNDQGMCLFPGVVLIGIKCRRYTEERPRQEMPADHEDPPSGGAGRRCWVTMTMYGRTAAEVTAKMKDYQGKYPHQGYSTMVKKPPRQSENGYWCAVLERYSTCE